MILALAVVVGVSLPSAVERCPSTESLDLQVEIFTAGTRLPGLAVSVFTLDEARFSFGGTRGGGAGELVPDTAFHHGSNGKAVTASLIGALIEDEELGWSTTPVDVFRAEASRIHPELRGVTLAQLLRHLAGLDSATSDAAFVEASAFEGPPRAGRRAYALKVLAQPAPHPVGEPHYSNAGLVIAAAMAEEVTGRPFEELVRDRVLEPLGIRGGFAAHRAGDEPYARGHAWDDEKNAYVLAPHESLPVFRPAGAFWMSLAGYVRFAQAHLRGLAGQDVRGFLSAATIRELHRPVGRYAAGWGVYDFRGRPVHIHLGGAGKSLALIALRPETKRGVLIAAAGGGGQTEAQVVELFRSLDAQWRDCVLLDVPDDD